MTTLHLIIYGRVQGVFYRDSMRREANRLGISGWVRNCDNGTVEAIVQGNTTKVDAIVHWARRGPEHAKVDKLDMEAASGDFSGFEILYD